MGEAIKQVALELQRCYGKRSGIGIYSYELARRMHDEDGLCFYGNLFNFLGRNDNRDALEGLDFPIRERHMMPYGVYRRTWNWLPVSYERIFPGKADLTVFFNYIIPPRIKGLTMTTVYDMAFLRFPKTVNRRNLRRIHTGIGYSVKRSSRVLTISEFSRKEIVELLGVPENKVVVIPCAAGISSELTSHEAIEEKFGVYRPYILYVGTIEPRKNLVRLLNAFSRLKAQEGIPHQLVIAGEKGWNASAFDEALANNAFQKDIILTGYVSNVEKNALYKYADTFVFPSLYEGFGIPPLEAMHWGCPVVAADAASLPEVVGDAAELVDPLDETAIAAGILRILNDRQYAETLKSRGYRQAERYSWNTSAEKFRSVCTEVLNER